MMQIVPLMGFPWCSIIIYTLREDRESGGKAGELGEKDLGELERAGL